MVGRLDLARRGDELVLPNLLAVLVFIGGVVLLVSGATPAVPERLDWLAPLAPLALIELSHFLGSLAGLALLVLALGLAAPAGRGLVGHVRACWRAGHRVLAGQGPRLGGSALPRASCCGPAAVPARLLPPQPPAGAALLRPLAARDPGGAGRHDWLGFFAYRHVDYANELWWQFVLEGDAPRFLRATAGVMIGLVVLGGLQLMRFAPPGGSVASAATRRPRIRAALAALELAEAPTGGAWLAARRQALPVQRERPQLHHVRRAGPQLDRHGRAGRAWPTSGWSCCGGFASAATAGAAARVLRGRARVPCPTWSSSGLTFYKLGEQALRAAAGFDLDGPARVRPAPGASGAPSATAPRSSVVPPGGVPASAARAAHGCPTPGSRARRAREKGFSLGRFDPDYLRHFPMALVRRGASSWRSPISGPRPASGELSVDLMRFRERRGARRHGLPVRRADALGQGAGLRRFDLGMAPLSGLQERQLAPLWTRAGALLFTHGEQLLQFRGPAPVQGEVPPGLGAALSGGAGRPGAGGGAGRRDHAGQRQRARPRCASGRDVAVASSPEVEVGMRPGAH